MQRSCASTSIATTTSGPRAERTRASVSGSVAPDNECTICRKQFTYSNDLRKHLRIHTDERPFGCEHCGQRFRQAGCLKNHVASQHGSGEQFSCHYCTKAFPIKERLRLHMRVHSGEKPYRCAKCQRCFSRGGQLKQHMITHSGCRANHLKATTSSPPTPNSPASTAQSCSRCGQSFRRKVLLKKHQQDCAASAGRSTSSTSSSSSSSSSSATTTSPFECDQCEAQFALASQLRVHRRQHSGERPYKCQVCWHSFAHSSVLKLHIRKHTGEKPFRCAVCPDTCFSQLPHLKTHMRTIHGMDKTYQCERCGAFYKTKNEQQLHTAVCSSSGEAASEAEAVTAAAACSRSRAATDAAQAAAKQQTEKLSQMRLCAAVLLKRISSAERLKQLGFEKVLIDNVIMAALKRADQPYDGDETKTEIDRFCVNVRYFLEWTIPKNILEKFEHKETNVKELLVKLTTKTK